jgi:hypothetical protein
MGKACLEIALQQDFDAPLLKFVHRRLPVHAHHAYTRFSVTIFGQDGHSASSIGGVAVRAQEQRNMKMCFAGARDESNFHERIKSRYILRGKVGAGVEDNAVRGGREIVRLGKQLLAASIAIRQRGANGLPTVTGLALLVEAHGNTDGRDAKGGVENMSRDAIHSVSHFFTRI